jgi:hypothetical protein
VGGDLTLELRLDAQELVEPSANHSKIQITRK